MVVWMPLLSVGYSSWTGTCWRRRSRICWMTMFSSPYFAGGWTCNWPSQVSEQNITIYLGPQRSQSDALHVINAVQMRQVGGSEILGNTIRPLRLKKKLSHLCFKSYKPDWIALEAPIDLLMRVSLEISEINSLPYSIPLFTPVGHLL